MQAILYDKVQIADAVNVEVISLDDAPKGYANFDAGASVKYVLGCSLDAKDSCDCKTHVDLMADDIFAGTSLTHTAVLARKLLSRSKL